MFSFKRIKQAFAQFLTGGYELLVPGRGSSDFPINNQTILTYAPIWYSTCKVGGHIAGMPRELKRALPDESIITVKPRASGNSWQAQLVRMMNLDANGLMTAVDLFETVQKDAMISGNGRLGIIRSGRQPVQLIRLSPQTTWSFVTFRSATSGTLSDISDNGTGAGVTDKWHHVTDMDGTTFILHDSDVIHIKGLQHDGFTGIPLWHVSRDSTGGGKTAEAHTNRIFANDAMPGLLLQAPLGVLTDDNKAKEFLTTFNQSHQGDNAGNTALLRYGVTATQLSMDSRGSQLLEQRMFSRDEAWLWTGDIQFYSGSPNVYRSGDELENAYARHTLGRWVRKWEAEMCLKLISPVNRSMGWYIDFDMAAILRGTLEAQMKIMQIARQIGTMSEEDTRRMLGKSPQRNPGENYENPNTSSPGAEPAPKPATSQVEDEQAAAASNTYAGSLERDKWIYDAHADGEQTLAEIAAELMAQDTWDAIGTDRGIRAASHRYADFHGLPRVNRHAKPLLEVAAP